MKVPGPVLAFGSDAPGDLLINAGSVVTFLREVAPHLSGNNGYLPIGEEAANGLALILMAVEETISVALTKI